MAFQLRGIRVAQSTRESFSERVHAPEAGAIGRLEDARVRSSALDVRRGSRVDLELVANVHEERNLNHQAGAHRGGFRGVAGRVALEAGIGLRDFKHHERGRRHTDGLVLEKHHVDFHVVEQEVHVVSEHVGADAQLIVRLIVHEDVLVALLVEVLHRALVGVRLFQLLTALERSVDDRSGHHVLELGSDERLAFARLHKLMLDHRPRLPVDEHLEALLDVRGVRHVNPLRPLTESRPPSRWVKYCVGPALR